MLYRTPGGIQLQAPWLLPKFRGAAHGGELTSDADERLAAVAYRVLENEKGKLEWHGRINGKEVIETKEPLTSLWLRFKAWFVGIVPESQL